MKKLNKMWVLLAPGALLFAALLVAQEKDPNLIDQSTVPPLTEGQGAGFCSQPNLPIIDNTTVMDTQTVPGSFTLVDVNVSVTLNHTWIGDLAIVVEHGGASSTLFDNECGNFDNMDILLDDEAVTPVGDNCASPYTGDFIPVSPLSVFDGLDAGGDWTLSIADEATADEGTLLEWCLVTDPIAVDLQEFSID